MNLNKDNFILLRTYIHEDQWFEHGSNSVHVTELLIKRIKEIEERSHFAIVDQMRVIESKCSQDNKMETLFAVVYEVKHK